MESIGGEGRVKGKKKDMLMAKNPESTLSARTPPSYVCETSFTGHKQKLKSPGKNKEKKGFGKKMGKVGTPEGGIMHCAGPLDPSTLIKKEI